MLLSTGNRMDAARSLRLYYIRIPNLKFNNYKGSHGISSSAPVPHGLRFGPLLFLLYGSDLPATLCDFAHLFTDYVKKVFPR